MLTLQILGSDESKAWTDWSGRGFRKKSIAEYLKRVCPSLQLTERKRTAKKLADAVPLRLTLEKPENSKALLTILEATGVVFTLKEEEPNQTSEPTAPSG